jgi:methionyl-tRNA synthetase
LEAAGLPLPEKVLSHGHWLKDNQKMSKSIGNVTCPFELLKKFGVNSVRTYMLAEGPLLKDANFDEESLLELHNSFLADQYCNLINRCIGKKFL